MKYLVLITSVAVIAAWQLGWQTIATAGQEVAMMPSTALCFALTYFGMIVRNDHLKVWAHMCVISIMFVILMEVLSGVSIGLAKVGTTDLITTKAEAQGEPSVLTILLFTVISCNCLSTTLTGVSLKGLGPVLALVSAIGVTGHALDIPWVYSEISGHSTGMALNTLVCFLLLGFSLFRGNE